MIRSPGLLPEASLGNGRPRTTISIWIDQCWELLANHIILLCDLMWSFSKARFTTTNKQ